MRNLGPTGTLLSDPAGARPGQWWPPVMLSPDWIDTNADRFDLMHVHFGMEALAPDVLAEGLDRLRAHGRPLVATIHDLEHPQLSGPDAFRDHLDVLLARADAVTTLTPGAARAIERGWDRRATVIPHPHMHPLHLPLPRRRPSGVVGMHLGDLRPNVDGPLAVHSLAAAVADLAGVRARVWMRDHVRDDAARTAVRACAGVELVEAPRLSDLDLARTLAGLDAVVLPYTHGTHSGWLELCWDLGVPVVAPAVGFFAEQQDVDTFSWDEPGSLRRALEHALARPAVDLDARRAVRLRRGESIAQRHMEVYGALLATGQRQLA